MIAETIRMSLMGLYFWCFVAAAYVHGSTAQSVLYWSLLYAGAVVGGIVGICFLLACALTAFGWIHSLRYRGEDSPMPAPDNTDDRVRAAMTKYPGTRATKLPKGVLWLRNVETNLTVIRLQPGDW